MGSAIPQGRHEIAIVCDGLTRDQARDLAYKLRKECIDGLPNRGAFVAVDVWSHEYPKPPVPPRKRRVSDPYVEGGVYA